MHDRRDKFSHINATSAASGKLKGFIPVTEGATWATVANMTDRVRAGNTQQQSLAPKQACNHPARDVLQTNTDNTERTYWKKMVKMSILPWRHTWLLVRIFKHKNTIPVLHSIRTACLPCGSQAKQWGWAGTQHGRVPLSQHEPRGRKHDSEPEFSPLRAPGCRGSQLPPCLGHGWGQGTPPRFLSLCWVLCRSGPSWIHLSDSYPKCRPRMLLLWLYKRKDRFIAFFIYASLGDNLTS